MHVTAVASLIFSHSQIELLSRVVEQLGSEGILWRKIPGDVIGVEKEPRSVVRRFSMPRVYAYSYIFFGAMAKYLAAGHGLK